MRLRFALIAVLLLSVASLPAFAQRHEWGNPQPPEAGACFYQDSHFGGSFFCMRIDDRWASLPRSFGDRISSIRVFGGARLRVFSRTNFRGRSLLINSDIDNLRRVPVPTAPGRTWGSRILSIAVFRDRDVWGRR